MPSHLDLPTFITKWQRSTLTERSAAQQHFLDLCAVLSEPTPAAADPDGSFYTFERGVRKTGGDGGWADVWKRGYVAWEYKGKRKDLAAAYQQLLQYREDLENPPLLVVCDLARFEVHTNFTGTVKQVYAFDLADLQRNEPTPTCVLPPLEVLRAVFAHPDRLRPTRTTASVTEDAARAFATLADSLRRRGENSEATAHFLMRLLFCLFAEDIDLLPDRLFTTLVERTRTRPAEFTTRLGLLFTAMATGGSFGSEDIAYFNGGLFVDAAVPTLTGDDLATLARAAALDWASIEPAIFGTLFERSLDPTKRAQLGAHYTSRDDILLIVEPVLMVPLRRRWAVVREEAQALIARRDAANGAVRTRHQQALERLLLAFADEIAAVRVLDPACGSGNFLYVALKHLLDLWKEVSAFAAASGVAGLLPYTVGPQQLYGIEVNVYAHELASVVVWIGYIQWLHDNGFGIPEDPILKPLRTIRRMDAVLSHDDAGQPVEPAWPEADVIVGNPPFLGDKKMRTELGHAYVEDLRKLYGGRVPGGADLVAYWFERARELIVTGRLKRAGLLATNSLAGGVNRRVLDRIKQTGDIFLAWDDRPWFFNGAAVRVAMVGFDNGREMARQYNGATVTSISADLKGSLDLTQARWLAENKAIAYLGDTKKGSFDIPAATAAHLCAVPLNPNGRPNSDVVRPWMNGLDVTRRRRDVRIVDFGVSRPECETALYEAPYEYVRQHVKPERDAVRNALERSRWWLHARPAPDMRRAVEPLHQFIATPTVAKHRLFVWLTHPTLADHQLVVFARADDYFFGVLHAKPHELWALRKGTSLEDRPRYTPTSTFETFPLPWPPGAEPVDDPRVEAIAAAARALVEQRGRWLNPEGATDADLKARTLTALYNARPTWLDMAHRRLDDAVLDAYGWPRDLGDDDILGGLLALNLERAGTTDPPALPLGAACGADAIHDDGPGGGGGTPIVDPAAAYVVYTDGSCKPNPGPGGWAYVLAHGDETREETGEEGVEQDTVSPRMEIMAVVRALAATPPAAPSSCAPTPTIPIRASRSTSRRGWTMAGRPVAASPSSTRTSGGRSGHSCRSAPSMLEHHT